MAQVYMDLFVYYDVTIFVILYAILTLCMVPRQIMGLLFHYKIRQGKLFMALPAEKRRVVMITTIYDEDPETLDTSLSLLSDSLSQYASSHAIICVIDAWDLFPDLNPRLAEIALRYTPYVFRTNVRSKRKNLRNGHRWARDNHLLEGTFEEILLFHDSDSEPVVGEEGNIIAREMLRPFADESILGVTSSQRIKNPHSPLLKVLDWLEDSRGGSSMGAGSLVKMVGCQPGRLHGVRASVLEGWMDELVEEYWTVPVYSLKWPFITWTRVQAHAGDDRRITMRVHELGGGNVMNPLARVVTTMPNSWRRVRIIMRRWATSNQWLTILSMAYRWFWRKWFVAYQFLGDLFITPTVPFLFLRWGYLALFSIRQALFPLPVQLLIAGVSVFFTFTLRQLWHLVRHPQNILLLPFLIFCVTYWIFTTRIPALFTPGRISVWGSRPGTESHRAELEYFKQLDS